MAQRRMFSPQIIDSDAFLDMPLSSQLLYFHLAMRADDDGFVGNPKKIIRMLGGADDDLKVLTAKRFILIFQSGVIVIKHWRIHNLIRADRYNETKYLDEKRCLEIKENGSYSELADGSATIRQPSGNHPAPQVRLGKVSIGKDNTLAPQSDAGLIVKAIDLFESVNPVYQRWYANKTQRQALDRLLLTHGFDTLSRVIALLPRTNAKAYFPTITTPCQLEENWAKLKSKLEQEKDKAEGITKGRGIAV